MIAVVILITSGCAQGRTVTVVLEESHPWEAASGRRFWYTLGWNGPSGAIEETHLSIGCRAVRILVPLGGTVVFAAYPLGSGMPFGGASLAIDASERVLLTMEDGPLADMLLSLSKRWPEPVARVNFQNLSQYISCVDPTGWGIDWNLLAKKIVEGHLSASSVKQIDPVSIDVEGLPEGVWVCEHAGYPELASGSEVPVEIQGLFPGLIRYLSLEGGLELRIVISEEACMGESGGTYWHVVKMDPLFSLSDAVYQELLELTTRNIMDVGIEEVPHSEDWLPIAHEKG